jgi:hypothetical protein
MKLNEIKSFLDKAKLGKYMTVGQFMLSLRDHDYNALVGSVRNGETLNDGAKRWAEKHAPDITIVDDDYDDGEDPGTQFKIVDDEDDE